LHERRILRHEWRRRRRQIDNGELHRFVFQRGRGGKRTAEGREGVSDHEVQKERDQNRQPKFPPFFFLFHHSMSALTTGDCLTVFWPAIESSRIGSIISHIAWPNNLRPSVFISPPTGERRRLFEHDETNIAARSR